MVGEFKTKGEGKFRFEMLPLDIVKLGLMEEIDEPIGTLVEFLTSGEKTLLITENIFYNTNSSEISEQSKNKLEQIVEILKKNPRITLELSAHTDSRGDDQGNLELSNRRALSAVEFIISKGISDTRVSGKGFGETKILNRCTNGIVCSEKEHKLNRRTEFKFVKN